MWQTTDTPILSFMSLATAARHVGLSVRTVRRWVRQGLPIFRAGPRAKILVRPADIEAFLKRQQAQQPDLDSLVDEVMRSFTNSTAPRARTRGRQRKEAHSDTRHYNPRLPSTQ